MDDKQMQELNALEQAAFNDPVNFLNQKHNPRNWTLSSEDIARSYSISPAQLLHTEDEMNPRKWNVAETLERELWNGAKGMFESTVEGIANSTLEQSIYRSNNMSKEDADRLVEDVLRSQVMSRSRQNLEDARRVHDEWSAGIGNGIGSVMSMALVGYLTRSPAAVGALTGVGEAYNTRNQMIDKYVEEQGTTEGVAGKLGEYNALSAAYGTFAGAVEASIGVERLAAGSLNRYGKLAALQRLARQKGQYGKSLAYKTGREFVASGAEEFGEEFLQSIGEDVAVALAQDMWQDPDMKKALTQGMFGVIIGAPAGAIFYNGARKRIIDYINKWNNDKQAGLTESQVVQMTDEILGNGAHRMVDDITTRVEIQEHFGKAYDLVKQRLTEQIDATGTTPWTDQNKSKEEYIQTLADSITIPAINAANMLHIPLSDFLEIADIEKATVAGNIAWLRPITSIADIDTIIANQDAIIKQQTEAKKLGVGDEDLLKRARQRKAIAQRVRKDLAIENGIRTNWTNRKKEDADYITAKDLQPEQVTTLESAVQAEPGQEYVLFAGKRIPVEYQVVELTDIQPSHIDGTANPAYTNTEMQNRASRGTTQDVADLREKATNITPERLMRASTAAEGAPVVNARGEVIAGNGRAEIVRYAYENPESTEKYKKALVEQGFNIEGMERPILVRRNTTLTDQEQIAAADISNISETSAFDEASQARRDVQYLKDSPTDIDFAAKLPMSERRGLMQNNGRWNKRKVKQRYEDAILAWLCGNDTQLFENLVLDRGLSQKVIDILTANGALVYETATKYPELQIREDIYHALIKMQRATRDNFLEVTQQLELDGRDVMPENILVYNWLFADPTTNRNFLSNYATILANNHENVSAGQDMFGQQVAPLSKKDALMQALKKADEAKAELSASRGREYAPLFDEEGKATDANLAAAIASYQNQFAPVPTDNTQILNKQVLEQFDLADENARLDDIYPEYTGETIEVDGKEHTVYNSNGDRIAKSKEALSNFWRWFGDSKMVDDKGRPLVVYHGSRFGRNIKEFYDEAPIWTAIDKSRTEFFTPFESSRIYSLYAKIENPIIFNESLENNVTGGKYTKLLSEATGIPEKELSKKRDWVEGRPELGQKAPIFMYQITNSKWFKELAKEKGFDGIITIEGNNERVAAVFNNNQIKSVENRGTFDVNNPNIYYQTAYISGTTYYEKPSTSYVLRGGEGYIVHGWGIYALKDMSRNDINYRKGQFSDKYVFVRNMPKIPEEDRIELPTGYTGTSIPRLSKNLTDKQNIKLHEQLQIMGAGQLADYAAKAQPYEIVDSFFRQIRLIMNAKTDSDVRSANNAYNFMGTVSLGKKADRVDKTYPDIANYKTQLPQVLQNVIDQALRMFNTSIDRVTVGQMQTAFEEYAKKHNIIEEYLTPEVMDTIARGQTDEYKNELKDFLLKIMDGKNPLLQPFDNSIFAKSDAQVLNFKEMESDALNVIAKARDTFEGGQYEMQIAKEIKLNPEEYGGFVGLLAIGSKVPFNPITEIMYDFNKGNVTLSNVMEDENFRYMKEDGVKKYAKAKIASPYDFFVSIIESAAKIYNSKKFKKNYGDRSEQRQTWIALSQAFQNMNQTQTDKLALYLFTTYNIKEKDLPIFIEAIQKPQNIKKTRAQQLEIDVPEDNELLNQEKKLIEQPSADTIRELLTNLATGGQLKDFIGRPSTNKWNAFRQDHNIKEKTLDEWYDNVFNKQMDSGFDPTEDTKLLVEYLMNNMTGQKLYLGLADMLEVGYAMLDSGEEIGGEVKDYSFEDNGYSVMGERMSAELARDVALFLNSNGIKGIRYRGGIDGVGYVIFSDEAVQTLRRMDDELPIYYQKRGVIRGQYDAELQAILLTKYWNETTLVHEWHHRFLEKIFNYFKEAQTGERAVSDEFMADVQQLFNILDIQPTQDQLTTVQQEKFATMVEAYLTGLGVDNPENLAFKGFLHWIPEQYKSILNLGYLDEEGNVVNPVLDEETVKWFNKWFANPFAPSLPTSPEVQHLTNATDGNGQIIASNQKVMNNREKDWGQDSEEQNKADAQLWRAINENTPNDMRAALDGEKERMKAEANNQPDDTKLPEEHKPTMREKWFKTYQPDARERAAAMAREYLAKNPEKARELAFADPETSAEYEAPVDRGMLIRAVMETVPHGSDEWYILNDNLATVKSMSGSTLSLSGDQSHQAYLDAKREVEAARELKAAINYAGTRYGAMEKWNEDIRAFIARKTAGILATEPNSTERKVAIKAFLEEAKTKFSANTTNAVFNQMDLTGLQTKNSQVFIKWAEKQIKQATHAKIDATEQKELMKASIAAQLALKEIDSIAQIDGKFTRAVQSAKDIRHWQFVKDKMKKAYIGRWGKWGIWVENLFGGYMPSAMLMSVNTLFFANVPSTALNTLTTRVASKVIGDNKVDNKVQKDEIERIRQVFNASGVNLAQMDKPTSPSTLHGEKYMNTEQKHWYNFTFEILGRTDNLFRIPTFVDTLARIATKNADGDKTKATLLFKAYAQINNQDEEAKMARKQALAVANMAVFTQDGMMATALNHIRSNLNTISRAPFGLDPNGFGLGNLLAPFLKTGVNITEMGLSATLALPRSVMFGLKKLQGKEITDLNKIALRSDWINLAWTAVMMALLCALSGDDDKWYEEPYQTGRKYDPNKPYDSIRFGNTWVKLDVFGPVAIPLRTAAMLVQDWEKRKLAAVADGMLEALSETPLIQSFTDSSMDYMQRQPGAYWSSFGYNQLNKFVPAQAKTLTRAGSRATGAKFDTTGAGKTISRKFHRNYGFDGADLTTNDLINILTNRLKYNPQ